MHTRFSTRKLVIAMLAGPLLLGGSFAGCPALDDIDLPGIITDAINGALNGNANNNSGSTNRSAPTVLFVRGRSIDGFTSASFRVSDIEFINSEDRVIARLPLLNPPRVDLLSADFSVFLGCTEIAPVGSFTKLRLTVTDPELVTTAGLALGAASVNAPANGKLDLNTQSRKFSIRANTLNILEFNLTGDDNAWSLNVASNSRINIRSEIFASARTSLSETGRFEGEILNTDGADDLLVEMANCQLAFRAIETTVVRRSTGGSISFDDLAPGDRVVIEAGFAPDRLLIATRITRIESD